MICGENRKRTSKKRPRGSGPRSVKPCGGWNSLRLISCCLFSLYRGAKTPERNKKGITLRVDISECGRFNISGLTTFDTPLTWRVHCFKSCEISWKTTAPMWLGWIDNNWRDKKTLWIAWSDKRKSHTIEVWPCREGVSRQKLCDCIGGGSPHWTQILSHRNWRFFAIGWCTIKEGSGYPWGWQHEYKWY